MRDRQTGSTYQVSSPETKKGLYEETILNLNSTLLQLKFNLNSPSTQPQQNLNSISTSAPTQP